METEEAHEDKECSFTEDLLTAEALVDLRKPPEEIIRNAIGDKFYFRTNAWVEDKAVESSRANLKENLSQKRAARVCDLMQAEWDEELNVSFPEKLKGKYIHHMGHNVNGKIALSPEESMFLLENGTLEIMNGRCPMSTEEGWAVMLKGKLAAEKYRVYSHLAQLGFIVVTHQKELAVTRYEMQMNLDKHQVQKRRGSPTELNEPNKKRLTFSGALSGELEQSSSLDGLESRVLSAEQETNKPTSSTEVNGCEDEESEICEVVSADSFAEVVSAGDDSEVVSTGGAAEVVLAGEAAKVTSSGEVTEVVSAGEVTEVVLAGEVAEVVSAGEVAEVVSAGDVAEVVLAGGAGEVALAGEVVSTGEVTEVVSTDEVTEVVSTGEVTEVVSTGEVAEVVSTGEVAESVLAGDVAEDVSEEINGAALDPPNTEEHMDVETVEIQNKETMEPDSNKAIEVPFGNGNEIKNVDNECSSDRHVNSVDVLKNNEMETDKHAIEDEMKELRNAFNSVPCRTLQSEEVEQQLIDSRPITPDVSSKNDIDVMDIDSQDTEVSCNASETSRDAFDEGQNNSTIATSQDSCCAVANSSVENEDANDNSNSDILSCYSSHSVQSDVLSLEADSKDSLSRNDCADDDITLLQVTKKEIKPLAVIDLLSDEEKPSSESEGSGSDDEISVVKVCSAPPGNRRDMRPLVNARKFYGCKKEEREIAPPPVMNTNRDDSPERMPVPAMFRKDILCVARPPLHFQPNNVKPSKEAYILDMKKDGERHPSQQDRRVWNSFREMQDYQRARRHRRTNETFAEFQGRVRPERISRPYNDSYRQAPVNGQPGPNPSPFNYGHPRAPQNGPPTYPMPNAPLMNSVVSIRQQNIGMVGGNHPFPPGFPPNVPLPNLAQMGPAQFVSEVQRTAYSVASNMISYMLNQSNSSPNLPPMPSFNLYPNLNGHGSSMPQHSPNFFFNQNPDRNGYRNHTGRPFPCHYRDARNKSSWEEVKAAVSRQEDIVSDDSDVEEVPLSPTEILWDPSGTNPLVKPGVRHEKSFVLNALQKTQMAKLNKCSLKDKCFQDSGSLEISFDVYLPGSNYRKTFPTIPKHRIIVVKSSDPIPRFSELAYFQRKWNDDALLQVAFVDNGDVSFISFNSVSLPALFPGKK